MSIKLRSKVWKISRANINAQRTQLKNDETEISKLAKKWKKLKMATYNIKINTHLKSCDLAL